MSVFNLNYCTSQNHGMSVDFLQYTKLLLLEVVKYLLSTRKFTGQCLQTNSSTTAGRMQF